MSNINDAEIGCSRRRRARKRMKMYQGLAMTLQEMRQGVKRVKEVKKLWEWYDGEDGYDGMFPGDVVESSHLEPATLLRVGCFLQTAETIAWVRRGTGRVRQVKADGLRKVAQKR